VIKKKGQIVPKYLCRSVEKKAQHTIKFGCDVEIKGKTIKALSKGYVMHVPCIDVLKKKNKRTWKGAVCYGVSIIGFNER
jgi:hypothetical protein